MKRCAVALLLGSSTSAFAAPVAPTKPYQGAWFSASYPASFRVRVGAFLSSSENRESAFFTSPDQSVTFYAFYSIHDTHLNARQFLPVGVMPDLQGERVLWCLKLKRGDQRLWGAPFRPYDGSPPRFNAEQLRFYTGALTITRARDGSTRELLTVFPHNDRPYVSGFYYRDEAARRHYQASYRAFQRSLLRGTD